MSNPQLKIFFGRLRTASRLQSLKTQRILLSQQVQALDDSQSEGWNEVAQAKLRNEHLRVNAKLYQVSEVAQLQSRISQDIAKGKEVLASAGAAPLEAREAFLINHRSLLAAGRLFQSHRFSQGALDSLRMAIPWDPLEQLLGESKEAATSYAMMLTNDLQPLDARDFQHSLGYHQDNLWEAQRVNRQYLEGVHNCTGLSERLWVHEFALSSKLLSRQEFEARSKDLLGSLSGQAEQIRLQMLQFDELIHVHPNRAMDLLEEAKERCRTAYAQQAAEAEFISDPDIREFGLWNPLVEREAFAASLTKPKLEFIDVLERLRATRAIYSGLDRSEDFALLRSEASLLSRGGFSQDGELEETLRRLVSLHDEQLSHVPSPSYFSYPLYCLLTKIQRQQEWLGEGNTPISDEIARLEQFVLKSDTEIKASASRSFQSFAKAIASSNRILSSSLPTEQDQLKRQIDEIRKSKRLLKEHGSNRGSTISLASYPGQLLHLAHLKLIIGLKEDSSEAVAKELEDLIGTIRKSNQVLSDLGQVLCLILRESSHPESRPNIILQGLEDKSRDTYFQLKALGSQARSRFAEALQNISEIDRRVEEEVQDGAMAWALERIRSQIRSCLGILESAETIDKEKRSVREVHLNLKQLGFRMDLPLLQIFQDLHAINLQYSLAKASIGRTWSEKKHDELTKQISDLINLEEEVFKEVLRNDPTLAADPTRSSLLPEIQNSIHQKVLLRSIFPCLMALRYQTVGFDSHKIKSRTKLSPDQLSRIKEAISEQADARQSQSLQQLLELYQEVINLIEAKKRNYNKLLRMQNELYLAINQDSNAVYQQAVWTNPAILGSFAKLIMATVFVCFFIVESIWLPDYNEVNDTDDDNLEKSDEEGQGSE